MSMQKHVRLWVAGLISAFLSGVSGVLAINFIDPADFNMENPKKMLAAALAFGIVGVVNYLKDKPLPPDGDEKISIKRAKKLSVLVLLVALMSMACLPKNPPAPVTPNPTAEQVQATRAKAAQLADAVKAIGDMVDKAQLATSAAYRAGLITQAARNEVYQAILDLEPRALAFIDMASAVTTDPSLLATVKEFLPYADKLVTRLEASADGGVRAAGTALRLALKLLYDYAGGVA